MFTYTVNKITTCVTRLTSLILCTLYISAANATITLTFTDNVTPLNPFPSTGTVSFTGNPVAPFTEGSPYTPAMGTAFFTDPGSAEFRMISLSQTVGGGGEKSIIDGGEQWIFGDNARFTAVTGTDTTPGAPTPASTSTSIPPVLTSASADIPGAAGLTKNANFLTQSFGFLAPTLGSPAALAYGNGSIVADVSAGTIEVTMPVLEAQWGGSYFPIGIVEDIIRGRKGVIFNGTMSNIQTDVPAVGQVTFDFAITAEFTFCGPEFSTDVDNCWGSGEWESDPTTAGFIGWTAQWELAGTGVAPMGSLIQSPFVEDFTETISAATPGTITNDGRVTLAEMSSVLSIPVDPGNASCVGSCFDVTVTGIANPGDSTQVVLPLTSPIPSAATYRIYTSAGGWVDFDTTGSDTIESAPGSSGLCTTPGTYTSGLAVGDYCVRLTVADGGSNDEDGMMDSAAVIPAGGLAVPPPSINSYSPDTGVAGDTVTIDGVNLINTTAVEFNGVSATIDSVALTQVIVTVPVGATTGDLTVIGSGLTLTAGTFTVPVPSSGGCNLYTNKTSPMFRLDWLFVSVLLVCLGVIARRNNKVSK